MHNRFRVPSIWAFCLAILALCVLVAASPFASHAAGDLPVYGDALAPGWDDWSWDATHTFAAPTPVHGGAASISLQYDAAWAGLSLRTAQPVSTASYNALAFWIHGGASGATVHVYLQTTDQGSASPAYNLTAPANQWSAVSIPFTTFGSPSQIARLTWQDGTGAAQPALYLDDIRLVAAAAPPATPTPDLANTIALTVDVTAGRHPISPDIYGMNFADEALAQELALPVDRWGGNSTTRYNWQTDISNHASDWYFENIKETNATDLPADSWVNRFIAQDRHTKTSTLLTMPMTGYVANGDDKACSFTVHAFGAQKSTDVPFRPDCGNGMRTDGTNITGNNPLDTSIAAAPGFVTAWINYLTARYGGAASGGVRFYALDNEPDLWFETHRDVAPVGWKYQEFRDRSQQTAAAIKAADPTAQTLGPVVNGWTYYWNGAYDGQRQDWASPDDRNANGGTPFVPWYLQEMQAYQTQHGLRLLDYLDLHYYPQSGVALTNAGDAVQQALRLRSTRSLWDPTYVDESWIAAAGPDNGIVRLLPRMHEWIDANYPGTKLAVTEYNFGGLEHINGALTQADVLGIFGREGLDLATLWDPPQPTQPGAFAFRIYRNYDGAGSQFGDTSVQAVSSDQAQLAIYAARRSTDNALTLVLINKTGSPLAAALTIDHFAGAGAGAVYRYSSANLAAIERQPDLPLSANPLALTLPANSITLLHLAPAGSTAPPPPTATPIVTPQPSPPPPILGAERMWLPSIRR